MKKILIVLLTIAMSLGLFACGGSAGENGEVNIYNFGDYIDPAIIQMFEEETGIKVNYSEYDQNEEMYPVIATGSADYDVICPSDYMITKMIEEGLLQEINFDNIPNYVHIDPKYTALTEEYDEKGTYSVPHTWGTLGIGYNTDVIPEGSITSWNDLWDPQYAGQVVMQDMVRDTLSVALKAKGYSINTLNEDELAEATDYLIAQKPNVYKYANDSVRDFLIGETAALGVVWNGEALYMKDANENIEFVVPEEGTQFFVDAWAITAAAKNVSNAEKWIDFMCRPDIAYMNFEYLTFSIANGTAIDMLDDEIKNNEAVFPREEIIDNCESLKNLGEAGDEMYSNYWKKYKAE